MSRYMLAASVGALLSSSAMAQGTDSEARQDTIVVTGQKIERTLQDTKESVAVLSDLQITQLTLLDLESKNDSATLVDLSAGYEFDRFEVSVYGRNVLKGGCTRRLGLVPASCADKTC
ncbi:MAG: hypothetical protein AAF613_05435 [Pseudomonadota bacterium]